MSNTQVFRNNFSWLFSWGTRTCFRVYYHILESDQKDNNSDKMLINKLCFMIIFLDSNKIVIDIADS